MLILLLADHLDHKAGSVLDLDPADADFLVAAHKARPADPAPAPRPGSFADFLSALATRSLSTNPGPSGGFLVPAEHTTRLFALALALSLVRPRATVLPMTSRELEVPVPDLSTPADAADSPLLSAVAVRWTPESAARPAADPTFKQAKLTDHTLTGHTKTSAALDAPATDALLTELFSSALAWHSDRAFLRGDGVGKPLGVLSWPGLITVTRSAPSAVAAADVAAMYARLLPPADPSRVVWALHPTALAPLLTTCAALITPGQGGGLGATSPPTHMPRAAFQLLGHDALVTDKLPPLNTAGDVLLMDLSHYLVGDRLELEIAHSTHVSFTTHQHAWRFATRVAGQPWLRDKVTLADGTSLSPFVALAAG